MSMKSIAAALSLMFGMAGASQAGIVLTPSPVQITWTLVYADAGNGDFNVDLSGPAGTCRGFSISPSSPTYKETMALVLLAKAKSRPVMVWMDDAVINSSKYCKLWAISVQ